MANALVLIAHNIRSAHNVGAFFRTADGAGIDKLYLTGYTATPSTKKFLLTDAEKQIRKTALGGEKTVTWEKYDNIEELIRELKSEGYTVYALEQSEESIPYDTDNLDSKKALLVGNEVEGISRDLLTLCDAILEIPMHGTKNSLNVSVATGIALYELQKTKK